MIARGRRVIPGLPERTVLQVPRERQVPMGKMAPGVTRGRRVIPASPAGTSMGTEFAIWLLKTRTTTRNAPLLTAGDRKDLREPRDYPGYVLIADVRLENS